MAQIWFYTVEGQKQGPVTGAQLKQLAIEGRILPTDLVWREGMADWVQATRVPGLFPPAAPTPPPMPPPQQIPVAQPYYQQGQYVPPGPSYGYPQQPPAGESHQGMAVAGFVLSLTVPILGIIFSAIALQGMKRTGNEEGKGLATAGLVIGIVLIGLWVLILFSGLSCFGSCCLGGPFRRW